MAIDKVEGVDLIKLLIDEVYGALRDSSTPGKITSAEWIGIAKTVGMKAFQEAMD